MSATNLHATNPPAAASPQSASRPDYPSSSWAWYTVAILLCAYIFSFIDRQILNLLVAPVRRDLHISDTEMSLLIGFSFAIFYSMLGLPFGRLADHMSRPRLILIGMFLWSLMTGGCGLVHSYWQLFLLRMGVGVGEATLSPAAYSMIADSFPPAKRSMPFSVYTMATYVGPGLAFVFGGLLLRSFGTKELLDWPLVGAVRPWQALFLILGIAGMVFVLALFTLRDPSRKGARILASQGRKAKVARVPLKSVCIYFLQNWTTLFSIILGMSLVAFAAYGTSAWGITFFVRNHGMTASKAGVVFGFAQIVSGALGMLAAGKIVSRLMSLGRRDAYARVAALACAGWLVPGILAPLVSGTAAAVVLIYIATFFLCMPVCLIPAAIQELVPNAMRGQAIAVYLLIVNLIGLGLGPTAIALVTDRVFHFDAAVRYSLAIVPGAAVVAAGALFVIGQRSYAHSLDRLALWLRENL
ncbi:MAG TPA: MFS transporter [Candidatus Sulfotelmatobacter sp.]|nr:MFS transporter [Candidatus Sulfotelmatobacter sp.]